VAKESDLILTIFVPVFGNSPYLEQCLTSLRAFEGLADVVILEDFPNLESNGLTIAKHGYSHIKHKSNLGLVGNFNFARARVSSKYFLIIGPDDELAGDPKSLISELNMNESINSLYYLKTRVIDDSGNINYSLREYIKFLISKIARGSSSSQIFSLMVGYWPYSPGIVWNNQGRKLQYRSQLKYAADFCLLAEYLLAGFLLQKSHSSLRLNYRRHLGSISGDPKSWRATRAEEINVYKFLRPRLFEKRYLSATFMSLIQPTSRIFYLFQLFTSTILKVRRREWK
jgi:glycosyltransferase involved in cell wall biosynthesis